MRKAICIILSIFGPVASFIFFAAADREPEIQWRQSQLDIVGLHLRSLGEHLRMYRQDHGRYPTNDEGLGALDNFVATERFRISSQRLLFFAQSRAGAGPSFHDLPFFRGNGREPVGPAELRLVAECWAPAADPGDANSIPATMALGRGGAKFLIVPGAVLSPWCIPYVYENRVDRSSAALVDSPADRDDDRRFSVRVDKGVFVSSTGAEFHADELDATKAISLVFLVLAGLFACGTVVSIGYLVVKGHIWQVGVALAAGLGLFVIGPCSTTCYVRMYLNEPPFSRREPEMVKRRRALLDRFHEKGVITSQAHRKALNVMDAWEGKLPRTPRDPE